MFAENGKGLQRAAHIVPRQHACTRRELIGRTALVAGGLALSAAQETARAAEPPRAKVVVVTTHASLAPGMPHRRHTPYVQLLTVRKATLSATHPPNIIVALLPRFKGVGAMWAGRTMAVVFGAKDAQAVTTGLNSLRPALQGP